MLMPYPRAPESFSDLILASIRHGISLGRRIAASTAVANDSANGFSTVVDVCATTSWASGLDAEPEIATRLVSGEDHIISLTNSHL